MAAFRTMDDLIGSLGSIDALAAHRDAIAASARPVVLFVRNQEPDDPLAVGTSKIGGLPDLPPTFDWPERPAYADADRRAGALMRVADSLRSMGNYPDILAQYRGKSAFYYRAFPLAFTAQINLALLASEAGFPPGLPRSGLLSVFQDIFDGYGGAPRLVWHEEQTDDLQRTAIPHALADYYDEYGHSMGRSPEERSWSHLTQAEVLHPVSAVMPPDHWRSAFAYGTKTGAALEAWMDDPTHQVDLDAFSAAVGGTASTFGDHLGGWPVNIQGDPEKEIDRKAITEPGRTPWRHIFSFGGENWSGTRLVPLETMSDGNTYIFLHETDLLARRFDQARTVHQMT